MKWTIITLSKWPIVMFSCCYLTIYRFSICGSMYDTLGCEMAHCHVMLCLDFGMHVLLVICYGGIKLRDKIGWLLELSYLVTSDVISEQEPTCDRVHS